MKRVLIALLMLAALPAIGQGPMADWWARWARPSGVAASVLGGAVDLDGSSEYLTISPAGFANGFANFTVGAWVKPAAPIVSWSGICWVQQNNEPNGLRMASGSNAQFLVSVKSTASSPKNSVKPGEWTLLVGVLSNTTHMSLYVNTSVYTNRNNDGAMLDIAESPWRIGDAGFSGTRRFRGLIDEVFILTNRCLSSNDIVELVNAGVGRSVKQLSSGTAGLFRLFDMDDGLTNSAATAAQDWLTTNRAAGTGIGSGDWTNGIVPQ